MHRFILLASVLANENTLSSRVQSELFEPVQRRLHSSQPRWTAGGCNGELQCDRYCTGQKITWGGTEYCWWGRWEESCTCDHCGVNEVYSTCGACEKTCDNMHLNLACPAVCEVGCFCESGYVRDASNNCIPSSQCPPRGCQCTQEYRPVCGSNGQTYSNSCEARCDGIRYYTSGVCPTGRPVTDFPTCICTTEYDPVCGSDGQTYSNECRAGCESVSYWTPGECPTGRPVTDDPTSCMCTWIYDPVCGDDGATYSNTCLAHCAGVYSYTNGECPTGRPVTDDPNTGCGVCTADYTPVCGSDGQTYSNECTANCFGIYVYTYGECLATIEPSTGCMCTEEYDPVCGHDGNTYSNHCKADCAEVAYYPGACRSSTGRRPSACRCTREYRPVCGSDGRQYNNGCLARCAGVTYTHHRCP